MQRLLNPAAATAAAGPRRETSDRITLFLPVGLAGTEVAVGAALLRSAE